MSSMNFALIKKKERTTTKGRSRQKYTENKNCLLVNRSFTHRHSVFFLLLFSLLICLPHKIFHPNKAFFVIKVAYEKKENEKTNEWMSAWTNEWTETCSESFNNIDYFFGCCGQWKTDFLFSSQAQHFNKRNLLSTLIRKMLSNSFTNFINEITFSYFFYVFSFNHKIFSTFLHFTSQRQ